MDQDDDVQDVFLFVNPTSGGNLASAYTKLKTEENESDTIIFDIDSIGKVGLHIFNVREGSPGDKPGFHVLKSRIEALRPHRSELPLVRIKVGGGDGTVMWVFTEILAHGIDPDEIVVGVIPFGTGNDFSRTLGWGGSPPSTLIGPNRVALKQHVSKWMRAEVVDFDLWSIEIETAEGGRFLFINDQKKKDLTASNRVQHNIEESDGKMTMSKPMCNYFSIGYDGRIGLGFDKRRTTSAFRNLIVYGWEGFKKLCFSRPPPLRSVVEKIESVSADGVSSLFASSDAMSKASGPTFIGKPMDLIYLNIPSYAKGCDIWSRAKRPATTKDGKKQLDVNERKSLVGDALVLGDQRLCVATYCGYFAYMSDVLSGQSGWHRMVNSARRVGQTEVGSKSVIHFRSKDCMQAKKGRVYMQIDGEFFVVEYPSKITVKHMKTVKVLLCPEASRASCCKSVGCGKKSVAYHERTSRSGQQARKSAPAFV